MNLLIDLNGRKAGGRHAVAQFTSPVRVNRCLRIPVNEHANITSRSHQPILVHASFYSVILGAVVVFEGACTRRILFTHPHINDASLRTSCCGNSYPIFDYL